MEIAETQEFLAEMRARIEELSEIQEQANTIRRITVEQTAHEPATSRSSADSGRGVAEDRGVPRVGGLRRRRCACHLVPLALLGGA